MCFNPTRYFRFLHEFFRLFGASLDVFNPFFFFFGGINCFVNVFLERDITVLIFVRSSDLIPLQFLCQSHTFCPSSSYFFFFSCFIHRFFFAFRFVFSFCLYNQAKHLSLRGLDHLRVFQRQCPRAAGISHRRCNHPCFEKAKSVAESVIFRG